MMPRFPSTILPVALALCLPAALRADELKLKDGTKIVGTIVGYEENSFRVKTNYGFAVVQKDQVLSISITDSSKKPEAEKKSEPAHEKPAPADQPKAQPVTKTVNSSSAASPAAPAPKSAPTQAAPQPPAVAPAASAIAKTVPPAAAAPPPPPPKPAAPEPMREEVVGNTYTNRDVRISNVQAARLGSDRRRAHVDARRDHRDGHGRPNHLSFDRPAAGGKSLASDIEATERRLRDIMENFRPLGEKQITVSGMPAVERRFRGSVDQHDWSGVVVFFQRGTPLYTIFGMTYAGSDLVQIQENVIARAISSLQFTKQ